MKVLLSRSASIENERKMIGKGEEFYAFTCETKLQMSEQEIEVAKKIGVYIEPLHEVLTADNVDTASGRTHSLQQHIELSNPYTISHRHAVNVENEIGQFVDALSKVNMLIKESMMYLSDDMREVEIDIDNL